MSRRAGHSGRPVVLKSEALCVMWEIREVRSGSTREVDVEEVVEEDDEVDKMDDEIYE